MTVAAGLLVGAHLHECQRVGCVSEAVSVETATEYDTTVCRQPEARQEKEVGVVVAKVRKHRATTGQSAPAVAAENIDTETAEEADSVDAELPITQKEYEGENYRAWVSGYEAKLDSVEVYSRREVVTIREPPDKRNKRNKRWGVGVSAGYGVTPSGMQPWVGVSISYNLWTF